MIKSLAVCGGKYFVKSLHERLKATKRVSVILSTRRWLTMLTINCFVIYLIT